MEFTHPVLGMVQMFVPENYQITSSAFFNYVRTLPEQRFNIRLHSLAIDYSKGIQIIEYLQGRTDVHEMTWNGLKNALEIGFKEKYPASHQYQMHLDQLNHAF